MSDPTSNLDDLRRALQQLAGGDNSTGQGSLRLAKAMAEQAAPDAHARCRAEMPAMAEAELRGERLAQLYPASVRHLDVCEPCSLEYAQLLDLLLEMEESVGEASTAPSLPSSTQAAMRIRTWVTHIAEQMAGSAQAAAEEVDDIIQTLIESLAGRATIPIPVQAQQWALGYGGEDETTQLLMATWFTTHALAERYSVDDMQALASRAQLVFSVRQLAEKTATAMKLKRQLRARFVTLYVAGVEADPAAFVALGNPGTIGTEEEKA